MLCVLGGARPSLCCALVLFPRPGCAHSGLQGRREWLLTELRTALASQAGQGPCDRDSVLRGEARSERELADPWVSTGDLDMCASRALFPSSSRRLSGRRRTPELCVRTSLPSCCEAALCLSGSPEARGPALPRGSATTVGRCCAAGGDVWGPTRCPRPRHRGSRSVPLLGPGAPEVRMDTSL